MPEGNTKIFALEKWEAENQKPTKCIYDSFASSLSDVTF